MKLFGKKVTKQEKTALISQFIAVVLSGIFAVVLTAVSFAWFSFNSSLSHSGMQVGVISEAVDIVIERPTEYESGYSGIVGEGGLKSVLMAEGYSTTAVDSVSSYLLANELVVEEATYEDKRFMVPGAYGSLTFYIRPKAGYANSRVALRMDLGGYADVYEDGEETSTILPVTRESVLNMLHGHVLFFRGRTGETYDSFVYSDQIVNGHFVYDMSQHSTCTEPGKTDLYKITIYWEWPITYYAIHDDLSTESPAVTKKYPVETGVYLEENPSYFYPGSVSPSTDEEKSDFYNDGDQLIGDNVDYFVVRFSVL